MKIYNRQEKDDGNFYFGNWGEIPVGISLVKYGSQPEKFEDTIHYHLKGIEIYLVLEGQALIQVEGRDFKISPEKMLLVEPGEKHFVKAIDSLPFSMVVFNTVKDPNDKVIV